MRRPRSFIGPGGMAGMVGLWGASSMVRSIQSGSRSMQSGTTVNETIAAVDLANSIALFRGTVYTTDADDLTMILAYVQLTTETNLAIVRNSGGGGTGVWAYTVIEFAPGVVKSVQRGTLTMGGTVTSTTATISSVNTAKSICIFSGHLGSAGTSSQASMWGSMTLINATTVTWQRNTGTLGLTGAYTVVEFF